MSSITLLLFILFFMLLFWYCMNPIVQLICCGRKYSEDKRKGTKVVISLIALWYMIYSSMARSAFGIFSCKTFPPEKVGRLVHALDVVCYDNDHLMWVLLMGIPFGILVIIGLPFAGWYVLYCNREILLSDPKVLEKYGFLFKGYQIDYWFWEVVIVTRKICLAGLTVFLASYSAYAQGMSALFVLTTALIIQLIYRPYDDPELNTLEAFGLICGVVTVYLGLWTFEVDVGIQNGSEEDAGNSMMGWIATVAILLINSLWFVIVFYFIFTNYGSNLKKYVDRSKKSGKHKKLTGSSATSVGSGGRSGSSRLSTVPPPSTHIEMSDLRSSVSGNLEMTVNPLSSGKHSYFR